MGPQPTIWHEWNSFLLVFLVLFSLSRGTLKATGTSQATSIICYRWLCFLTLHNHFFELFFNSFRHRIFWWCWSLLFWSCSTRFLSFSFLFLNLCLFRLLHFRFFRRRDFSHCLLKTRHELEWLSKKLTDSRRSLLASIWAMFVFGPSYAHRK